ncbi:hypothetical protein [Phaeobacter sp. S60]|nr:hypothetical protein [Phaeobacter sp. S60]
MLATFTRPVAFLRNLACLDAGSLQDAFFNEALETFGRFDAPSGDRTHRWELDLHGVCADGASAEEAMANWKRLASQHFPAQDIEDDGFITVHPRMEQRAATAQQGSSHAV